MTREYYVDRITNVSVQGAVVTIDLGRLKPSDQEKDQLEVSKKLTLTLTGTNFINLVNTLNGTVKAINERSKKSVNNNEKLSKGDV